MKFFRKFLATIFIYASMNVAVSGAFGLGLLRTYFNPDFYKSDFFNEIVYDAIVDQIVRVVKTEAPELEGIIAEASFKNAINRLLPSETLVATIDEVATQLTRQPWPDELVVSLKSIKENLTPAMDAAFEETGWPVDLPRNTVITELQRNVPGEIRVPIANVKNRMTPDQEKVAAYLLTNASTQIPVLFAGTFGLLLVAVFFLVGTPRTKALRWVNAALFLNGILIAGVAFTLKEWGSMALEAWGVTPRLLLPITSYMNGAGLVLLALGTTSTLFSIGISRNWFKHE